jgi:hypothetical protein
VVSSVWRDSLRGPVVRSINNEVNMIQTILGIALFVGMGYAAWKQIPPEDPETIEARKRYGRVDD